MQTYASINGNIIKLEDANIHITDLGLLRGMGIFDYFLVENNVPPLFKEHMNRYKNSLDGMGLEVDVNIVKSQIEELITKNNFGFSSIKVVSTGGFSDDEFTLSSPNTIIINRPMKFSKTLLHEQGGRLISCNYQRELSHVKTTNYLQALRMQKSISENEAIDVLYINNGMVRECSRCNIFMVKDGKAYTPVTDILNGVTRGSILLKSGLAFEKDFSYEDLISSDEVFITNTTRKVTPIIWIDGHKIGEGKVGTISKSLIDQFS